MILQTNSYIVPKEKRSEHARLLARFRQCLARLGCDHFECYEQVGTNWSNAESSGRFVQIMRFRDRKQQQRVQTAERSDPAAQTLIKEFCDLINFPYQQQQGFFVVGFYSSVLAVAPTKIPDDSLEGSDAAVEPLDAEPEGNGEVIERQPDELASLVETPDIIEEAESSTEDSSAR